MRVSKVRLVAAREVTEGARAKSYRVGTVVMALLLVGAVTIPAAVANSDRSRTHIGVVGELAPPLRSLVTQVAHASGTTVRFDEMQSRGDVQVALRKGRVQLVAVEGREILVRKAIPPGDVSARSRLATTMSVLLALEDSGPAPVNALEPAGTAASSLRDRLTGYGGVLVIFMFIITYGMWIVSGVADEKTNRLVEVLLAAVRPLELLVGKVIGVGALALGQATIVGGSAFLGSLATGSPVVRQLTGRMVLVVLGWFVLAYALYGLAYAALGSTVGRQEDTRSVPMPLMVFLMVGYIVPIGSLSTGQDSGLLRFLSMFPPTAPMSMTMRIGMGTPTGVEVAVAVALMLVAIAATAWAAGRIYSNSILRTGQRVRLRQAIGATPS